MIRATYRHWGRGHQFHSLESLTSAHRVTKGTQPSECHLSAGGCGVLYQATGEGLGQYSEEAPGVGIPCSILTCHHSSGAGSAFTWLSLHNLGFASTESHLLLACYMSVLKPTSHSRNRNRSPCLSRLLRNLFKTFPPTGAGGLQVSNITRLSLSSALGRLSRGERMVQHFLGMGLTGHNGKRGDNIRIESGWPRTPWLPRG